MRQYPMPTLFWNQKIKKGNFYNFDKNQESSITTIFSSPKSFKLLHVTTSPSPSSESSCISPAHLISPPSTVPLPSNCSNVKLQNLKTSLQIHENNLLIPTQSELINHVDLVSTQNSDMKPFMMTLIKDYLSEDVRFSTNNVLMLLSSIHPIGTSFGRVTAESGYRIRYYIVGTDKISIDADTGELILKERFYRNLNDILIVAVIPKGIAKAKVRLSIRSNFELEETLKVMRTFIIYLS